LDGRADLEGGFDVDGGAFYEELFFGAGRGREKPGVGVGESVEDVGSFREHGDDDILL
jgi:hypothetical protein